MDAQQLVTVGRLLETWSRVLILTHDRADGDAIGAVVAMRRAIVALGHQAEAFLFSELPPRYRFLDGEGHLASWAAAEPDTLDIRFDGVLILDTCSWTQLEPAAAFLRQTRLPKIVVDHHATRDDLTASSSANCLIDATSASACGLLHEWCRAMQWEIDERAALALFSGITTDTGWFRFSNTDGRTLRAAAELIDAGVDADVMFGRLMESYSVARLRLMGEILATLELHADGMVAMMSATRAMFEHTGATQADTEDIVNEPMGVTTVGVSILLCESPDGRIRVNLRSKSPEILGRDIDVAAVARALGGGGHTRAAGARVGGTLAEARKQVLAAVETVLKES